LLRSGYYTNVLLEVKDSVSAGESHNRLSPQFHLRVREREVHYVNARAGVAQDSLRDLALEFQGGFCKRNIFKTRRAEFSANFIVSPKGDQRLLSHRYRLRYVEPWFVGVRMPLSLSGEYEPAVRSVLQPFRIQRWRIDAQTLFEIGRRLRVVSGIQYESVEIFDVDTVGTGVDIDEEGISVRRKMYLSLRNDTRDDLFVPRRGTLSEFKFDYYGDFLGGDANFAKVEVSLSKYQPFWKSIIRASRIKFGVAEPLGSADEVPLIDRYYIGGANGVRGFSTEELPPPLDPASDVSPGAEFYVIFNQELRFPVWGKLWSSLFIDAGNGWEGLDDPRISFDGLAYSYGAGVQYLSPAGPLRLDYARRIKTHGIDHLPKRNYRFHFTILYAF
jgi:outer membrane protein insertion porin family